MAPISTVISRSYRDHLQRRFAIRGRMSSVASGRLGQQVADSGMSLVELALLHEQILTEHLLLITDSRRRNKIIRIAGDFFGAVAATAGIGDRVAVGAERHLPEVLSSLSRRSRELAESNAKLMQEIEQRKIAEAALATSEASCRDMLADSEHLQDQLRRLSRQLLTAQEQERCKISRELHDVIGQTLTGINIQLTALRQEAKVNTVNLERRIASTQRLVNRSVAIVHRFARELRPAVLDDLGLLPALEAHLKSVNRRSKVHITLSISPDVDRLGTAIRTTLYRVAQEGLTNMVRHARASNASLTVTRTEFGLCMVIQDDGKGFSVTSSFMSSKGKRLGLLGMRERVEMLDGRFTIVSIPYQGTTLTVDIPIVASSQARPGRKSGVHSDVYSVVRKEA